MLPKHRLSVVHSNEAVVILVTKREQARPQKVELLTLNSRRPYNAVHIALLRPCHELQIDLQSEMSRGSSH